MTAHAQSKTRWELRPLQVQGLNLSYRVGEQGLSLGRDSGNVIRLDEQVYPHVSGRHAQLSIAGERLTLKDLKSKNGTFVNGRRVDTAQLTNGDVIQLGSLGPSFKVSDSSAIADTLAFSTVADGPPAHDYEFGKTTIINLKRVLGIPEESQGVGEFVAHGRRRYVAAFAVSFGILALLGAAGFYYLREGSRELREENMRISSSLREYQEKEAARVVAERDFEATKQNLLKDRELQQRRLAELENQENASIADVQDLKQKLKDSNTRLELFNPVSLERGRLENVRKVLETVVLVENSWKYRDTISGKYLRKKLHFSGTALSAFELGEGEGEDAEFGGTGSGFCVSAQGHILTNAHVVKMEELLVPDMNLVCEEQTLTVVFTGESQRYSAKVLATNELDGNDIALLKIEPQKPIPALREFTTTTPVPELGSEVYLFGFPLGKHALQEGEKMIASTFKGIMSREVAPYLQVDAAVHPGNSGGPVVNRQGEVVGVVVGVQTNPGGGTAAEIGYVIPIERVSKVWPIPGK